MIYGIGCCRDRTCDIRLVRADELKNINDLDSLYRIKTCRFGDVRSTNVAHDVPDFRICPECMGARRIWIDAFTTGRCPGCNGEGQIHRERVH
jgi:hypothetical protein